MLNQPPRPRLPADAFGDIFLTARPPRLNQGGEYWFSGGKMKAFIIALCIGLLIDLNAAPASAQATAQISGTVRDQSGAVLPGVEVTATQTETGIKRSTVTNETGSYVLPELALGPYRVEAALPGFRTYAQTGIVLQVNS